jgi:hypothetical protein
VMIDLLDDLNQAVARSAACALGQMGRIEARPMLATLLREEPSKVVIDAVSSVADEECIVLLGRIARSTPASLALGFCKENCPGAPPKRLRPRLFARRPASGTAQLGRGKFSTEPFQNAARRSLHRVPHSNTQSSTRR